MTNHSISADMNGNVEVTCFARLGRAMDDVQSAERKDICDISLQWTMSLIR